MSVMRSVKNIVNNYTDAEVKVREATSNDPWGPSSTLMAEIADLTYNVVAFTEIMQMIWKRLNDHGKNWRHVYKALTVLEYIIKTGSEKVSQQCKENVFAIQTLKDFQYTEEGKDHGVNVREKAKALVTLLKDDERLKNERAKALKAKERLSQSAFGIGSEGSQTHFGGRGASGKFGSGSLRTSDSFGSAAAGSSDSRRTPGAAQPSTELEEARPSSLGEEELQLQLALAMSKEEAEAEERRRRQDDLKLQLAIEESRKETPAAGAAAAPSGAAASSGFQPPPLLGGVPVGGGTSQQPQRAGQAVEASATEKLLDFDLPTPKTKNDPWAATVVVPPTAPTAPSLAQVDPFQPLPAVTAPSTDPWSVPAAPATLPSQPAPAAAFDPWTNGAAKPLPPSSATTAPLLAAKDPWSVAAPAAASSSALGSRPGAASGGSPWDVLPPSAGGVQTNGSSAAAVAPSDEFEAVFKRTAPTTASAPLGSGFVPTGAPAASNGSTVFDLSGMDQALNAADRKPKNPEDFLGANAKLVNLDSLVTRTPPSVGSGSVSVFGGGSASIGGGSTVYGAVHGNPFAAQQPPRPSLHQMTSSSSFGQLPPAVGQPPVLMATGGVGGLGSGPVTGYAGAGALPYYPGPAAFAVPALQAQQQQQQQQSYNPFL